MFFGNKHIIIVLGFVYAQLGFELPLIVQIDKDSYNFRIKLTAVIFLNDLDSNIIRHFLTICKHRLPTGLEKERGFLYR